MDGGKQVESEMEEQREEFKKKKKVKTTVTEKGSEVLKRSVLNLSVHFLALICHS